MLANERVLFFFSFLLSRWINLFARPRSLQPDRILLFRLDELGDMVTTLPVFAALRQAYPTAEITLFCKPYLHGLLAHNPNIDHLVSSYGELTGRYKLILDMRGDWDSLRFALGQRPAYRIDRGSVRFLNRLFRRQQAHEVIFNRQLLDPLLGPASDMPVLQLHTGRRNLQQANLFLQRHDIHNFVVFHTGARKLLRRWGLKAWAALAQQIRDKYGYQIVFAGSAEDIGDIARIQALIPFPTYSFADQGSLLDFAALVAQARLMVGNESGPMHVSSATATPTLALFGPGQPEIFSPYGEKNRFLHHKLPCNPCDQVHCVFPENPCINRITVAEVMDCIDGMHQG